MSKLTLHQVNYKGCNLSLIVLYTHEQYSHHPEMCQQSQRGEGRGETLSVLSIQLSGDKDIKGRHDRANNDGGTFTTVSTLSSTGNGDSFDCFTTLDRLGEPNKTLKRAVTMIGRDIM